MMRLPKYIPPWKGNAKLTNDPNIKKFIVSMPLFPEHAPFEVPRLMRIPLLKMEDWDITGHTKFPNLGMEKYMHKIYYEEMGVITFELMEWVHGAEKSWLLKPLLVPHYHCTPMIVHDGCLWLGEPIPIMNMLIHIMTQQPYKGANPAKEFGGKTREKELTDKMKKEYELLKKL